MEIRVPDPHPGRCQNYRHDWRTEPKSRRCLDRDGHKGACTFPEPRPTPMEIGGTVYTQTVKEPTPWVPPWEVDNG